MPTLTFPRFGATPAAGPGPIDDAALRRLVPSAFAPHQHASRSRRYTYIPTSAVIDGLRAHGFEPTFARQGRCRLPGKADFTKHLIRFRFAGPAPALRKVGDTVPEVVLVNSHDGTSAYQLMAGVFRLVCLNGLIASDRELATIRVPHKGDVVRQVIEGSHAVLEESRRALGQAEAWSAVTLSREEQMAMAEAAHVLRFGEDAAATPIRPEQMLTVRRREDEGRDLWTTANMLQEHVIRGGLTAWGRDPQGRPRRVTTREIRGIDGDVRLNRALWRLSERMAELKAVA